MNETMQIVNELRCSDQKEQNETGPHEPDTYLGFIHDRGLVTRIPVLDITLQDRVGK